MRKGSSTLSLEPGARGLSASRRQLAVNLFRELKATSLSRIGISRETYGASETAAIEVIERHARNAGLETTWDPACNLRIRLPGNNSRLSCVATGSHLDSVPEGGNFDGAAGVVAGLSVLLDAQERGGMERDLLLYALRGEESAWFGGPCYFGSRALFGGLTAEDFASPHRSGHKTLEDSMRETGVDVDLLKSGQAILNPANIACWFELHIEQGPVLIAREKPVGLVTGIRGNIRHRQVTCRGEAAHSGAVPRWLRHDAVLAMSDLLVRIDEHWRILLEWGEDLVITAGVVETNAAEHAVSRVPGEVTFALEYRSQNPKTLESFGILLQSECKQVGDKRGVTFDLGTPSTTAPAKMSPMIVELLEDVCNHCSIDYETMPSGAGHDSSVFANAGVQSGMIFVRNDKGSHNPHETMDFDDFFQATEILNTAMQVAAQDRERNFGHE